MAYRILHTADWHLGKSLNDQDRHEEHRLFLDWLLETVQREKVDAVLVAGDVFDTSNPSTAAEGLYYDFVARLNSRTSAHLVVIAGNHDSAHHLEAPAAVLRALRAHVVGFLPEQPAARLLPLPSSDNPQVLLALIPFLRERDLRLGQTGESNSEVQSQIRQAIAATYEATAAAAKAKCPVVATGHLTVAGAATSESERDIHIGGLGAVEASLFPSAFAYVALGHLHRPQAPDKQGRVRYAGSPFPLSFSEAEDRKEVRILEIADGRLSDRALSIPVFRRLLRVSGRMEELPARLKAAAKEPAGPLPSWVEVEVKGLVGEQDLADRVRLLAEDLPLSILKVVAGDMPRRIGPDADLPADAAQLEDLLERPRDVFERLLDQQEGLQPGERKALLNAFAQLLERVESNA